MIDQLFPIFRGHRLRHELLLPASYTIHLIQIQYLLLSSLVAEGAGKSARRHSVTYSFFISDLMIMIR